MIIDTRNLTKRFKHADAVSGVSLRVAEGDVTALVGANGAGKTTMLRLLVNLLRPDSGEATILGVDSQSLGPREFARIGYVSENQKLPPGLTVDQFFGYLRALYPAWNSERENLIRRAFDLPAGRKLGQLSRGMQMKARIASVLPYRPKLLILDEPLSGLDPLVRDEVLEGLLSNAEQTTILISSHELTELESWASHVAFMDKGQVLIQDSMDDLGARFRGVTAGFAEEPNRAASLPQSWLSPEWRGRTLHFTSTAYTDDEELGRALASLIGPLAHLSTHAMTLRDTSKALIRAYRKEADQ